MSSRDTAAGNGHGDIVGRLLASEEPSVRLKVLAGVMGLEDDSPEVANARDRVRSSARVRTLLSPRTSDGTIPGSPYAKYTGAHWVLTMLADIGYPPGDPELQPLRDQVYSMWLAPERTRERVVGVEAARYKSRPGVPIIRGRARRCASQEGNALWATLMLGMADDRAELLARNLIRWQWPDGGWNCDRKASATTSSFMESLAPLRALALHARRTGSTSSRAAAERAAELFLARRLYRRKRDGEVMNEDFVKLHYPCFWQYDILFGLKVMAEVGLVRDPRCRDSLDLLESKRLADGGFPAERKHYRVVDTPASGGSLVDWGGTSRKRTNEFVTADALFVLARAGRLSIPGTGAAGTVRRR